jgi:hypothetical protein
MVDSSFPIKKELHKIIANLNEKGNIWSFNFYASEMKQHFTCTFSCLTLQQGLWTQISFFINGEQEGKIGPV